MCMCVCVCASLLIFNNKFHYGPIYLIIYELINHDQTN